MIHFIFVTLTWKDIQLFGLVSRVCLVIATLKLIVSWIIKNSQIAIYLSFTKKYQKSKYHSISIFGCYLNQLKNLYDFYMYKK